jgi:hypothetical protein
MNVRQVLGAGSAVVPWTVIGRGLGAGNDGRILS